MYSQRCEIQELEANLNMKKLLGAVLALMLLCMATAFADVQAGDTVTVNFTCISEKGCAAMINVVYDSNVLEYVSATGGNSHSANRFAIMNIGGSGFNTTVTYTFQVKAGAAAGTYHISAVVSECSDLNENPVNATVTGGTSITIAGSGCQHKDTMVIKGKAATCIEAGATEKTLCIACGKIVKPAVTLPATGHTVSTTLLPVSETVIGQELAVRFTYECGDVENAAIVWKMDGESGELVSSGIAADDALTWESVMKFSKPGAFTINVRVWDTTLLQDVVVIAHNDEVSELPEDLVDILDEAFVDVDVIEFVLPEGVQTIGNRAFADNEQLVLVNIPDSVTAIADNAFDGCEALTLVVGEENTYVQEYAEAHEINYVIW